jgi:glycosyltransferase involved in cell wall biosynthesis
MRILFLTKQQYMGKDLLRDRFGRFYEFPRVLTLHDHHVRGICLKYWDDGATSAAGRQYLDDVDWQSFRLSKNWVAEFFHHFQRLTDIATDFAPEIIVGVSDAMHVILAASLSARVKVPFVIDLYDDFESYGATRLPGITTQLRRAVLRASGISTVSSNLASKVMSEYRATGIVRTITNAVCPEIFQPGDKMQARKKLGLPESEMLVGTAGDLSRERGVGTVLQAFQKLSRRKKNLCLVMAGRLDRRLPIPANGKVRYLGELPHRDVGLLFNALDVGVVSNRRDQFAESCFPQKFYEMIACRLPMVAADVGVMSGLLAGYENCLYQSENADCLADAIERQLDTPSGVDISAPTWEERGRDFHELLMEASRNWNSVSPLVNVSGTSPF